MLFYFLQLLFFTVFLLSVFPVSFFVSPFLFFGNLIWAGRGHDRSTFETSTTTWRSTAWPPVSVQGRNFESADPMQQSDPSFFHIWAKYYVDQPSCLTNRTRTPPFWKADAVYSYIACDLSVNNKRSSRNASGKEKRQTGTFPEGSLTRGSYRYIELYNLTGRTA